jgi:sugar phosphate isomerase/epimerase
MVNKSGRREFLGGMMTAVAASGFTGARSSRETNAAAIPESKSVRLGGPVYGRHDDPEEMAMEHVKLGYRAAYCPAVSLDDTTRIRATSAAFEKHGVVIAEVGRWVNLVDTGSEAREKNMKQVTDGLALAEAIGALCCVDIVGSYSPTSWMGPHPDNLSKRFFDEAVSNARTIIDAVKPRRARFCYEMMGWSLPDSPDSALALLKAVDREAFGIHLDPCNLVNSPARYYHSSDLLHECFDKLGRWIVSCHAKDLTWDIEMNIHFREVVPGRGSLDYKLYLDLLAALPQKAPLMLEHLASAQEYDEGRRHIMKVGTENGISFG